MASILDSALLVGKETTYGTAATLTRAYEAKDDTFKRKQEYLTSNGFRGGRQARGSTRSVPVDMGGDGTISVDVTPKGFGLLFQSMLGSVAGPTQQAATTAYKSTFTSTAAGSTDSWTVQMQKVDAGGTSRPFTYAGSMMTGWKLSQPNDGLLGAEFMFDCASSSTAVAAGSVTYATDALPYAWTQASATWNGSDIDLKSFELEAALGLDVERRYLGTPVKKKPVRASVPEFTGTADMEFESLTQYAAFVAGDVEEMVVTWRGDLIASTYYYELKVTLPAVQFQGDTPVVSLEGMPMQSLPFIVLDNGTDAAVKIEYTSTDTAL
jgi:hypothetical protein